MTTTPARDERRDRIEDALRRTAQKKYYETDGEYYAALADAVIAADQARAAEVRAAAFDEAADAIDTETRLTKLSGVLEPDKFRPCRDASAQLRRMAAAARHDNTTGA